MQASAVPSLPFQPARSSARKASHHALELGAVLEDARLDPAEIGEPVAQPAQLLALLLPHRPLVISGGREVALEEGADPAVNNWAAQRARDRPAFHHAPEMDEIGGQVGLVQRRERGGPESALLAGRDQGRAEEAMVVAPILDHPHRQPRIAAHDLERHEPDQAAAAPCLDQSYLAARGQAAQGRGDEPGLGEGIGLGGLLRQRRPFPGERGNRLGGGADDGMGDGRGRDDCQRHARRGAALRRLPDPPHGTHWRAIAQRGKLIVRRRFRGHGRDIAREARS